MLTTYRPYCGILGEAIAEFFRVTGCGYGDVPAVAQLGAVAMDHEQAELLRRLSGALGPVPREVLEQAQAVFGEGVARRDEDENADDEPDDLNDETCESRPVPDSTGRGTE
ncbi:hypothetical protein ABVG11_16280 [Streptomyces sp. HD1123-B1]|uniref:hypothetical protein n=1 Tax=Streptomyces huangiella TaxID=3228804 RepID=UPI003D7F0509